MDAAHIAEPDRLHPSVKVHESSYVDGDVEIAAGTLIWHFCHIMTGSRIGKDCRIGQNVVIGPRAVVGNNVKIQNNVSVYEGVALEDDVFCGPSMVFTNVYNPVQQCPGRMNTESRMSAAGRRLAQTARSSVEFALATMLSSPPVP